jgi:uncharacterized membrane protein
MVLPSVTRGPRRIHDLRGVRYSCTQSFGQLVVTVFDAIVMVLIWQEWKIVRRHGTPDAMV